MIGSSAQISAQQIFNDALVEHARIKSAPSLETQGIAEAAGGKSFDSLLGKFVGEVDAKAKVAASEANKMLLGETDNIHQSMIAMQESSLAFTLMVEVRNKLVQSYQELIRMPV